MTLPGAAGMSFRGFVDGATAGPLVPALAASIALHAAVLAGLPDIWTYSDRPAAAPLNARLEPGTRAPGAAAPQPAEPRRAEPDPPQPKRDTPSAKPAASAPAATAIAPAERPVTADRTEPASAAPVEPVSVAASAASAKGDAAPALALGTPTLAPRPGDDALDVGSLAQYRLALIGAAKQHKRYPSLAVDRGLEGRVDVRLVIGADGELAAALVKRSSGHEVLDRQALDTMRTAKSLTPIPPALRNREFTVEIPLLYELKNAS